MFTDTGAPDTAWAVGPGGLLSRRVASPGQELLQGEGAPTSLLAASSLTQGEAAPVVRETEQSASSSLLSGVELIFQARPR